MNLHLNILNEKKKYIFKKIFLNNLIKNGKKQVAECLFFKLLVSLKKNYLLYNNFDIFYYSFLVLRPLISLKTIKISSNVYKVPSFISEKQRKFMAVKLLLTLKTLKNNNTFLKNLEEIMFLLFLGKRNIIFKKKALLYQEIINNQIFLKILTRKIKR